VTVLSRLTTGDTGKSQSTAQMRVYSLSVPVQPTYFVVVLLMIEDDHSFRTVAMLVADLERAIASPETLRTVISTLRDLEYYYGKVNLKVADLKIAAIALLADLRIDLADIEAVNMVGATTQRLEAENAKIKHTDPGLSQECLKWLSYSGKAGIVMVRQAFCRCGCDKWVTYGSHAHIFTLLTRREAIVERGYSKIEVSESFISLYESLIQNQGVSLTFVY